MKTKRKIVTAFPLIVGLDALFDGSNHDYYPAWLCITCGMKYGKRTPKFATWHEDDCGICGKRESVTEPRDFGHLKQNWRDGLCVNLSEYRENA